MNGFDAEFESLEHYILVITERIWEGRRLDDISRYYSDDCVVETPLGISQGIAPVIEGTRATLAEFPDRELLPEDVLVSGDSVQGYLSSHRIFSPMTHRGSGRFGAASQRAVRARTIADCVCRDNRIVHEWLVRDHAAIAHQIGLRCEELAARWLEQQPTWSQPQATTAPQPYQPELSAHALAQMASRFVRVCWAGDAQSMRALSERALSSALPGGLQLVGWQDLQDQLDAWLQCFSVERIDIEHASVCERPQRAPAVNLRWRAQFRHSGVGRFGEPTGRTVEVLAIQHLEWHGSRVARQWLLIDEVAIWMQLLKT
jgi:predicted ester cyclase